MDAEVLSIHDGSQRKTIEGLHAGVVDLLVVLDEALGLEGEILAQMPAFVIAANQMDRVLVENLEGPKIKDDFDAEIAAIHVVSEKEVSGLVRLPAHLEQLDQVHLLLLEYILF